MCSQPVDPSCAAVFGFRRDGAWHDRWAPFVEDLRTDPSRIVHPRCYVADQGLDALLGLIQASDAAQRRSAFSSFEQIMELRRRLPPGD
jgi:hypothetical protein